MKRRTERGLQRLAHRLMADRISLPEAKSRDVQIRHEDHATGDTLMLVNFRVAVLSGLPHSEYTCREPTTIHSLYSDEDGVWMTDLPCELVQMYDGLATHARGSVLIGGLGLGLLARMVARMDRVTRVTVVESSQDVANLVWPHLEPHLAGKGQLVIGDIHRFDVARKEYNVALLDTWQGTGEWEWITDVVPLRRRLARKIPTIKCWQEEVMQSQVAMGLLGSASFLDPHI